MNQQQTIVGSAAIRPGMAIVTQGQHVIYDGPVAKALKPALDAPGSVMIVPVAVKVAMDQEIERQAGGKPYAKTA